MLAEMTETLTEESRDLEPRAGEPLVSEIITKDSSEGPRLISLCGYLNQDPVDQG